MPKLHCLLGIEHVYMTCRTGREQGFISHPQTRYRGEKQESPTTGMVVGHLLRV